MIRRPFAILPCLIVLIVPCLHGRGLEPQQAESAKDRLSQVCAAERFEFTPKLLNAFLAYAKQQAFADLKAERKSLPEDFLESIDADSVVEAGVYGVHHKPADVLLWLYSLRLNLGKQVKSENPFLATVWFPSPHGPHKATPEYAAPYMKYGEKKANYYGELASPIHKPRLSANHDRNGRECRRAHLPPLLHVGPNRQERLGPWPVREAQGAGPAADA